MRGADTFTESLFSVIRLEEFVPRDHPLRAIREWVNEALKDMDGLFVRMYAANDLGGRPSIAPEKLLRAMLLQVLFGVRSERQLMEQVQYNLLYRWFIGLAIEDRVWDASVFSKNRERLIDSDAVVELFNRTVETAERRGWLSGEHFSVDGTLIQAWAGQKSFKRRDGSDGDGPKANFKGESRSNATHVSSTDADARLYRKGNTGAELSFMGHALNDNRHGLVVNARATQADGHAERDAASAMLRDAAAGAPEHGITVGADKGYDAADFVGTCLAMKVTPHVAQNTAGRASAVPDAIAATENYTISQRARKRIEQVFGWSKTVGGLRQVMVRGLAKVDQVFVLTMATYNLVRMRNLA
ncbi:MAG: IS5 family transposase, partial [Oscillospiraceae bacterium]